VTFDFSNDTESILRNHCEPWTVTLIDTGSNTMTGGRLKRVQEYVGDDTFCLTYGDGVSDVDLTALIEYHRSQGTLATLTAIQPSGRFGVFSLKNGDGRISHFREKPEGEGAWINGGFFVLEPAIFDYIDGDATVWEKEPLESLARNGQLSAYRHQGFWQPMDTLRDKNYLEELWQTEQHPWKVW
jgi:glucose-1-phosphate cytidylyltransferase